MAKTELQELKNRQEQVQEDLRTAGLREFGELYNTNVLLLNQIKIIERYETTCSKKQ